MLKKALMDKDIGPGGIYSKNRKNGPRKYGEENAEAEEPIAE